ncbi:MAG: SPASM domain-containing protein [Christensenellales bacterium]
MWRNAKYLEKLRKLKNKDSECVICKFYNFCNGGCPARNLKNENSLENKGDNKCQILINKATSTI